MTKETMYQVGDKLLVREDLIAYKTYASKNGRGLSFVNSMKDVLGKVVTVNRIDLDGSYRLNEIAYSWTDEMFVGKVVDIKHHSDIVIGDYVLIRDDLELGEEYEGEDATDIEDEAMLSYKGKISKVIGSYHDGDFDLEIDDDEYLWSYGMFVGKLIKNEELLFEKPKVDEEPTEVAEEDLAEITEEFVAEVEKAEVVEEKEKDPSDIREIEDYKYKVGDKVRIKTGLTEGQYDAEKFNGGSTMYFNPSMAKYCGMEATVVKVNTNNGTYKLDIDKEDRTGHWDWSIGMIDSIVRESHTLNAMAQFGLYIERVIYNEPATILFYRVPDVDPSTGFVKSMSNVKKVVAKCIPTDTFDKDKGLHVAMLKAVIKSANKELRKI